MKLPSFDEFLRETEGRVFSGARLNREDSPIPFSKDQGDFLVDAVGTMVLTALERYHEWLQEKLDN